MVYKISRFIGWSYPIFVALVAVGEKFIPETWNLMLGTVVFFDWHRTNGYFLVATVPLVALVSTLTCRYVGEPWIIPFLDELLTNSRREVFKPEKIYDDPVHFHRVTLFIHKQYLFFPPRSRWQNLCPWGKNCSANSGWLIPIARSEHIRKKVRSKFCINDDGSVAEGVGGLAWILKQPTFLHSLPEITAISTKEEVEKYEKDSNVPSWWLKNKRDERNNVTPLYRSLAAIPINLKGKIRAMLIIDSTKPNSIQGLDETDIYSLLHFVIGRILERK